MNVLFWSSVKWNSKWEADAFKPELDRWLVEQKRLGVPTRCFVVSGTYSDPALCPVDIPVINAEVEYTHPHEFGKWDYAKCAGTTGFWYAFFDKWWDVLVYTDTTTLLNCDFKQCLEDFLESGKMIMCPTKMFGTCLDNGFAAYSRKGVVHYLHNRKRPDLSSDKTSCLSEEEMTEIFEGHVYNRWPTIDHVRVDWGYHRAFEGKETDIINTWPAITKPSPLIVEMHKAKYNL